MKGVPYEIPGTLVMRGTVVLGINTWPLTPSQETDQLVAKCFILAAQGDNHGRL